MDAFLSNGPIPAVYLNLGLCDVPVANRINWRSARVAFNIPHISKSSTTEMLKKLEWESLKSQRQRRRICLVRAAMHYNEVNTNIHQYVSTSDCLTSTRRHGLQYRLEHHNTKAYMSTFLSVPAKLGTNWTPWTSLSPWLANPPPCPQAHWYPDLETRYGPTKQPYCQSLQLHEVVINSTSK